MAAIGLNYYLKQLKEPNRYGSTGGPMTPAAFQGLKNLVGGTTGKASFGQIKALKERLPFNAFAGQSYRILGYYSGDTAIRRLMRPNPSQPNADLSAREISPEAASIMLRNEARQILRSFGRTTSADEVVPSKRVVTHRKTVRATGTHYYVDPSTNQPVSFTPMSPTRARQLKANIESGTIGVGSPKRRTLVYDQRTKRLRRVESSPSSGTLDRLEAMGIEGGIKDFSIDRGKVLGSQSRISAKMREPVRSTAIQRAEQKRFQRQMDVIAPKGIKTVVDVKDKTVRFVRPETGSSLSMSAFRRPSIREAFLAPLPERKLPKRSLQDFEMKIGTSTASYMPGVALRPAPGLSPGAVMLSSSAPLVSSPILTPAGAKQASQFLEGGIKGASAGFLFGLPANYEKARMQAKNLFGVKTDPSLYFSPSQKWNIFSPGSLFSKDVREGWKLTTTKSPGTFKRISGKEYARKQKGIDSLNQNIDSNIKRLEDLKKTSPGKVDKLRGQINRQIKQSESMQFNLESKYVIKEDLVKSAAEAAGIFGLIGGVIEGPGMGVGKLFGDIVKKKRLPSGAARVGLAEDMLKGSVKGIAAGMLIGAPAGALAEWPAARGQEAAALYMQVAGKKPTISTLFGTEDLSPRGVREQVKVTSEVLYATGIASGAMIAAPMAPEILGRGLEGTSRIGRTIKAGAPKRLTITELRASGQRARTEWATVGKIKQKGIVRQIGDNSFSVELTRTNPRTGKTFTIKQNVSAQNKKGALDKVWKEMGKRFKKQAIPDPFLPLVPKVPSVKRLTPEEVLSGARHPKVFPGFKETILIREIPPAPPIRSLRKAGASPGEIRFVKDNYAINEPVNTLDILKKYNIKAKTRLGATRVLEPINPMIGPGDKSKALTGTIYEGGGASTDFDMFTARAFSIGRSPTFKFRGQTREHVPRPLVPMTKTTKYDSLLGDLRFSDLYRGKKYTGSRKPWDLFDPNAVPEIAPVMRDEAGRIIKSPFNIETLRGKYANFLTTSDEAAANIFKDTMRKTKNIFGGKTPEDYWMVSQKEKMRPLSMELSAKARKEILLKKGKTKEDLLGLDEFLGTMKRKSVESGEFFEEAYVGIGKGKRLKVETDFKLIDERPGVKAYEGEPIPKPPEMPVFRGTHKGKPIKFEKPPVQEWKRREIRVKGEPGKKPFDARIQDQEPGFMMDKKGGTILGQKSRSRIHEETTSGELFAGKSLTGSRQFFDIQSKRFFGDLKVAPPGPKVALFAETTAIGKHSLFGGRERVALRKQGLLDTTRDISSRSLFDTSTRSFLDEGQKLRDKAREETKTEKKLFEDTRVQENVLMGEQGRTGEALRGKTRSVVREIEATRSKQATKTQSLFAMPLSPRSIFKQARGKPLVPPGAPLPMLGAPSGYAFPEYQKRQKRPRSQDIITVHAKTDPIARLFGGGAEYVRTRKARSKALFEKRALGAFAPRQAIPRGNPLFGKRKKGRLF